MRDRKIVYLVPDPGINLNQNGGAGTHIRGTINGLKAINIDVLPLIAGDIFGPKNKAEAGAPVQKKNSGRSLLKKIVPGKLRLLYRDILRVYSDYKFEKLVFEQIKNYNPHAIYERSALFSTCGIRISKKLNIPLILESDGCMPEIINKDYGLFSVGLANLVEKYKLKKTNYISAYNAYSRLFLSKKFDVSPDKIIVKPLGISVGKNPPDTNKAFFFKEHYNLKNKKVVGFVGAISKYHGVNLLIDCAEILHRRNISDIVIIIVGWSKEAEELKSKSEKLNLTNIIFTGKVDKDLVPTYYELFDVGVIPDSEPTIYPVKVLEYGAYGLCPVVPDYEVFGEIMTNKVDGFFFEKNNVESLVEVIMEIFKTNGVEAAAQNWQQKVLSEFTWEKSVRQLETLIKK